MYVNRSWWSLCWCVLIDPGEVYPDVCWQILVKSILKQKSFRNPFIRLSSSVKDEFQRSGRSHSAPESFTHIMKRSGTRSALFVCVCLHVCVCVCMRVCVCACIHACVCWNWWEVSIHACVCVGIGALWAHIRCQCIVKLGFCCTIWSCRNCIKDRLTDGRFCLNLHPCITKLSQSVFRCFKASCLSVWFQKSLCRRKHWWTIDRRQLRMGSRESVRKRSQPTSETRAQLGFVRLPLPRDAFFSKMFLFWKQIQPIFVLQPSMQLAVFILDTLSKFTKPTLLNVSEVFFTSVVIFDCK